MIDGGVTRVARVLDVARYVPSKRMIGIFRQAWSFQNRLNRLTWDI